MQFDGSDWVYVGDEVFLPLKPTELTLIFDNGVLRIAFLDVGASSGTTVMEFGSADSDGDGINDDVDNSPYIAKPGQENNW